MAGRAYEPGEITALGEAIYQEQLRSRIGPVEKGTFVVIDVETGDYEIDARGRDRHAETAETEAGRRDIRSARRTSRSIQSRRRFPGARTR